MQCRVICMICIIGLVILTLGAGCGSGTDPIDPLDPELVRELALAQGTASGDARSGDYELTFSIDTCDCPSFEYEGQTVDLCMSTHADSITTELGEGSGTLAMSTDFGLFTGAIEADDSFVVAGITDLSTIAGPLEALRRMDGQFSSDDQAAGWAGQRLIGEIPGESIDCRWIGSFALARK